jgi:putative SOS response-associated peptidase YedK
MCKRYVLPDQMTAEREFSPSRTWWNFPTRFNVAAQQYVPAIRWHDGQSKAVMMRWGLIPSWAEGKWIGLPPACLEIDAIQNSLTYRTSWLNSQRCILPVAGFYAWQLTDAKFRQPFFVRLLERSVFGFAGVWDRSVGEDDVPTRCANRVPRRRPPLPPTQHLRSNGSASNGSTSEPEQLGHCSGYTDERHNGANPRSVR